VCDPLPCVTFRGFDLTARAVAFTQVSINGALSGRVADTSGAVVAGASVVLTNADTRGQQTATTNDDGQYNFPRLAPGVYNLRVERQGFSAAQIENIRISVNESAVADAALQVGDVSATVTVEADREITQTQTSSVSQIVETREIAEPHSPDRRRLCSQPLKAADLPSKPGPM